jgi:septal ring factor EnvC (AmiA/AmiB activator)
MKQTIEAVKSDNKELTQQLYSSYKRIVDLNKQVEYLTSKIETMETQLELFSKDKLK